MTDDCIFSGFFVQNCRLFVIFWYPHLLTLFHVHFPLQVPTKTFGTTSAARSVTTLQETLAAQVPEKQKALGQLKKEHGDHV